MKKVLLVVAALSLMATPALASIVNSAHDLSSSSTYTRQVGGDVHNDADFDRVCAFCHTPHAGAASMNNAPLWNRTDLSAAVGAWNYYNSATLETASQPTQLTPADSDVPLCMSCHDGSSLADALTNEVNGLAGEPNVDLNIAAGSTGLIKEGAGVDLTNDHPVGFNYVAVAGSDSEIDSKANAITAGALFFGTNGNFMWCSSCHNVHEPGTSAAGTAPFLIKTNNGSGLCLSCHLK